MSDPELSVMYYVSFLKAGKEKVKKILAWSEESKKDISLMTSGENNPVMLKP